MGKKKSNKGKKGSAKKTKQSPAKADESKSQTQTNPQSQTNPQKNPQPQLATPLPTPDTALTYDDFNRHIVECKCKTVVDVHNTLMLKYPDMATAVAAIQSLTWVVVESSATTLMELQKQINQAGQHLLDGVEKQLLSIKTGVELFNRYVTSAGYEIHPTFEECKQKIADRGKAFSNRTLVSRQAISILLGRFLRDGLTVLVHGRSRVVAKALLDEAKKGKYFNVICTESRPDCAGYTTAKVLTDAGIPVRIILDSAVGHVMETIDLVVLGAEGVVENGGIINKVGSYGIAVVAKALNKPVYVAAEIYKFARLFPLNQKDIPGQEFATTPPAGVNTENISIDGGGDGKIQVSSPLNDFTPAEFLTLLFTDIGILTPSAVSDELIKLYET